MGVNEFITRMRKRNKANINSSIKKKNQSINLQKEWVSKAQKSTLLLPSQVKEFAIEQFSREGLAGK